mmetsp:Transcript_94853/g.247042  ORF Transcript_94853/g.247042 Transcript_94853/m.247042 type:complete len:210 (+) Transcript_94853:645-1274(+)
MTSVGTIAAIFAKAASASAMAATTLPFSRKSARTRPPQTMSFCTAPGGAWPSSEAKSPRNRSRAAARPVDSASLSPNPSPETSARNGPGAGSAAIAGRGGGAGTDAQHSAVGRNSPSGVAAPRAASTTPVAILPASSGGSASCTLMALSSSQTLSSSLQMLWPRCSVSLSDMWPNPMASWYILMTSVRLFKSLNATPTITASCPSTPLL